MPRDAQQFEANGYVVLKGFFTKQQADKLLAKSQKLLRDFDLVSQCSSGAAPRILTASDVAKVAVDSLLTLLGPAGLASNDAVRRHG